MVVKKEGVKKMSTEILDGKGEGEYYIAIYEEEFVNGKSKLKFHIRVFDIRESKSDNDWIKATTADTEEKAREVMDKFYEEYYPEAEK